jgi:hypothetical protein
MSHHGSNCPSGHTRRRQKKPPTAPHQGAAAELSLGNVRYRGCQPRLRTTGCGRKQTSITAKPSPQFGNLPSWLFRSRNRAAVAHRVRAMARAWILELRQRRGSCPMARRSTRGPCAAVSRAGARQAPSGGVVFSWLLLFYSGHSALRPSGQLRCSRTHPACTWTSKGEVTRPPQEVESSSL